MLEFMVSGRFPTLQVSCVGNHRILYIPETLIKAMLRHRRANSYSQGGAGVAPFWKLSDNAVSSECINTSLVRGTLERRSTGRKPVVGKGYSAIRITLPAAVKFAVSEDPWLVSPSTPDMSLRPRSPPRSRNGGSEMQQLDQTLAIIREQLVSHLRVHMYDTTPQDTPCAAVLVKCVAVCQLSFGGVS